MATSPNYGWSEPDNSSLVKNGAQDIRALGDAIDTSVWNIGKGQAGKNLLINGLLDIWQRSTSVTGQANGYATVDRWYLTSSASCTFAQETTTVPAGCRYSQKVTIGASAASTAAYQAVETLNTMAYVGQNITFSARFQSSATPSISLVVEYSTTVDQPLAQAGWTAITATSGGTGTAGSASFTTISGVYAIPSNAKSLRFSFTTVGTMASGAILYYGGFQAEQGTTVTPLVRNGATIQGELAACQRYYWRSTDAAGQNATYVTHGTGVSETTRYSDYYVKLPVTMRTRPSSIDYSNLAAFDGVNIAGTPTAVALILANSSADVAFVQFDKAGSFTQFRPSFLLSNNSAAGFLAFNAEL